MTFNEYLTLGLSGLALLVSVVSAVISFRQVRTEIREQLNEIVRELLKTQSEAALSSKNPKLASLARQGDAIIVGSGEIATDIDCSVIADSFAMLGDLPRAAHYWQRAVDLSPSDFYRVMNKRGYAQFLFFTGQHELGRKFYREALEIYDVTTDFNKATNGFTYQMWYFSEASSLSQSFSGAEDYYRQARGLFESISSIQWKRNVLSYLENARSQIASLTADPAPNPNPPPGRPA